MSNYNSRAKHYVRTVQYVRTEYQLVDSKGNQKSYVDPEMGKGEIVKRQPSKEEVKITEPLRIPTEFEAGMMGIPYEGEIGMRRIVTNLPQCSWMY